MSERNAPVDEALDMVLVEMAEACIAGDIRATAAAVRKAHARLFAATAEMRDALRPLAKMMESVTPHFMGYEDGHHDNEPVNGFESRITVGHVRRAAKLVGR